MSRILFFVLLALAIYLLWHLMRKKSLAARDEKPKPLRLPMVSCATCGLHVPRDEALVQDERYFCCEEHRRTMPPAGQ